MKVHQFRLNRPFGPYPGNCLDVAALHSAETRRATSL
jgi:hypothetical protein